MQVIVVPKRVLYEVRWYSCSIASRLISKNQYKVPVDGIHSETLRTRYRDTGGEHGVKLGRDVFFKDSDLEDMGYEVDIDKYEIQEKYLVWL